MPAPTEQPASHYAKTAAFWSAISAIAACVSVLCLFAAIAFYLLGAS